MGYLADDSSVGRSDELRLVPSEFYDSVYVIGESGVSGSNADCGQSPPVQCKFHYHSNNGWIMSNQYFNARLGYGLPYMSHFSSSGNHHDSEIVDIDDNGQYWQKEEFSEIEGFRHTSGDLGFLSLSYTQDNRQNTDTAQFAGSDLTFNQNNGFLLDLNSTSISIQQRANLSSNLALIRLSDSKIISHSEDGTYLRYHENESEVWSTLSRFGTPESATYVESNQSILANSFTGLNQGTMNFGNITLNITTTGFYHLRLWYSEDYDADGLADEIDPDSDADGILDIYDNCLTGIAFYSNFIVDRDQDGCRDNDEDTDDDGDGKNDTTDQCPTGTMYWTRIQPPTTTTTDATTPLRISTTTTTISRTSKTCALVWLEILPTPTKKAVQMMTATVAPT